MLVDKITSKKQLINALADELDACFDQSYPVVDLTDQIVATVMDSAYSDPDVNDWLHGHEVVSIEPLDSHESYSIMERFALSRPDGQSQRLCDVLSKKHPFGSRCLVRTGSRNGSVMCCRRSIHSGGLKTRSITLE